MRETRKELHQATLEEKSAHSSHNGNLIEAKLKARKLKKEDSKSDYREQEMIAVKPKADTSKGTTRRYEEEKAALPPQMSSSPPSVDVAKQEVDAKRASANSNPYKEAEDEERPGSRTIES
mmetsp:Transcript_23977/g.36788  ORF Transcript_23977/g.36788 Transcript_23977/m.36788 type:complete len:121 (-) Transcript_23977:884-1246(-)|eukprot:CAMPEP_0170500684 /NCGR_PEP_ID=MMETSP0208-20121228/35739_1 /TAXON_ID=197538 /ORGANISM="Strombidium inclinatum, Strain S3" /LENGTH=120 /DNA_ID=CAMNT_0010778835 /DNA_START=886 /DNA_END=1248 /DNA_ORIENTATION=+